MGKKLWIVLAAFLMVTGCSANNEKTEKKQSNKTEQTAKKKNETSTTTAAADSSADADRRMEEGLKVCGPLINDTNDILTQAVTVNGNQTSYDYKKIQEGIDKADAAIHCGNNFEGLDGAKGTVKYKKTLEAIDRQKKNSSQEKTSWRLFLRIKMRTPTLMP
ncbi:hypothetical protein RCG23_10205 [Neobacillus sp. PS3-34]|uniref:hypothetical protein n=1 Tax=Neobacillus sp. PS3-34 TaxID=3070678 RepID=UPI0027E13744|nr:hypothetical protein [Neobacillus sp. PS3-34]WML50157.1 hypothetical protein RCG23_10205 [Neobacillus sp. PS3-34]